MPHQRVRAIRLLAKPLLGHGGADALRHLAQLQQRLPLRLKHLFIRALHAVDSQRNGHKRANEQHFADEREHLSIRAVESVDIDRLSRDKRFRQESCRFGGRVVQAQIALLQVIFGFAIQDRNIAELFGQRKLFRQANDQRVQRVRREPRALDILKDGL